MDGDGLRVVAAEFVGNDGCMGFSFLPRRELFPDVVDIFGTTVTGLEAISGHSESSIVGQRRTGLAGPIRSDPRDRGHAENIPSRRRESIRRAGNRSSI